MLSPSALGLFSIHPSLFSFELSLFPSGLGQIGHSCIEMKFSLINKLKKQQFKERVPRTRGEEGWDSAAATARAGMPACSLPLLPGTACPAAGRQLFPCPELGFFFPKFVQPPPLAMLIRLSTELNDVSRRIPEWFGLEGTFEAHPVQPPYHEQGDLQLDQVAPSNLTLKVSRGGASPTSLGNLGQCLTTLRVKNFLLISIHIVYLVTFYLS